MNLKDEGIKFSAMILASMVVVYGCLGSLEMSFLQRWLISFLVCGVVDNFMSRSANTIKKYKEAK
jgi:hypothetical protein